jgi:hypothetical protein
LLENDKRRQKISEDLAERERKIGEIRGKLNKQKEIEKKLLKKRSENKLSMIK